MAFWDGQRWIEGRTPAPNRPSRFSRGLVRTTQALLEGSLIALLTVGLVAGTAFAGRGGNGGASACHGKKCAPSGTATVNVSPNPVPAYDSFQVTGCGYTPNAGFQFNLYAPGVTAVWGGTSDGSGCLVSVTGWASTPGSARLDVLEGSTKLVATTSFTIE